MSLLTDILGIFSKGLGALADSIDSRDQEATPPDVPLKPRPHVLFAGYTPIRQAGNSCYGHAVAELYRLSRGMIDPLSGLFPYYFARALDGRWKDEGTTSRLALKAAQKWGLCTFAAWPSKSSLINVGPNTLAVRDAYPRRDSFQYARVHARDAQRWLSAGHPLIAGWDVDETIFSHKGTIEKPLRPMKRTEGGHAMVICGFNEPDKRIMLANWWGSGWGQNGFGVGDLDFLYAGYDLRVII